MVIKNAYKSLVQRLREVERAQWVIGGMSVLATAIIIVTFLIENRFGYLKPDTIIAYFHSWDGALTAADVTAMEVEERGVYAEADAIARELAVDATDIKIVSDTSASLLEPTE